MGHLGTLSWHALRPWQKTQQNTRSRRATTIEEANSSGARNSVSGLLHVSFFPLKADNATYKEEELGVRGCRSLNAVLFIADAAHAFRYPITLYSVLAPSGSLHISVLYSVSCCLRVLKFRGQKSSATMMSS